MRAFVFLAPTFMSSCGFGFIRTSAPMRRFVSESLSFPAISTLAAMTQPPHIEYVPANTRPLTLAEYQNLYSAIGETIIHWASVELQLDRICHMTFERAGGNALERKLPFSLKRKLRFLRKCIRELPALKPAASQLSDLLDRVEAQSVRRHTFAHATECLCKFCLMTT